MGFSHLGISLFLARESMSLTPIVMFYVIRQFGERIFDGLNKIPTTRGQTAQADDRVSLGLIVRHGQHFAIIAEAMSGPFNQALPNRA